MIGAGLLFRLARRAVFGTRGGRGDLVPAQPRGQAQLDFSAGPPIVFVSSTAIIASTGQSSPTAGPRAARNRLALGRLGPPRHRPRGLQQLDRFSR